jgi:tetratricopeptide (TPR) repeat protein
VSSPTSMDEAYQAFLSSGDLGTWTNSLRAFEGLLPGAGRLCEARSVDVLHTLTIAVYVAWLSRCHGNTERTDQALKVIDELGGRVDQDREFGGSDRRFIQVVIAAAKGYHETARRMVNLAAAPPVEIALLTVPQRAAPKAAILKPFVLGGAGTSFLPALYFYGAALLDLGYLSDAKNLLKQHGGTSASPLIIDLRGQLLELAGSWREARTEYEKSQWASHIYRRAVCDLILGESIDSLSQWSEENVKKFVAGMLDFSGETDRAGVLRSTSFVRACRWNGFDNWLVHFELGRLSYQRRRHAEAERHLAAAARTAPEPYRFAIRSLRFTNLTWLGDAMETNMEPETLEAGYAALQEQATEEQKASIRTWLGRTASESDVLDPALISGHYERGIAHHLRGSVPDAIECWHACIERSYTPRAFFALLKVFASSGFEKTASSLAETVALESHDSFFDIWELAWTISGVLEKQSPTGIGSGLLEEQLNKVETRMEELVESEFQNAIRAIHYFLHRRRPAPARRVLGGAERLAEGSEEHLLLAIARRKAAFGGWDPRVLDNLIRAEHESEDRFERLLIARELVQFGQLAFARAILEEEGVFSIKQDLTAIDYVLALQCAKLCADEARQKLLERAAIKTLQRDVGAGRFCQYGKRFADRLNSNLSQEPLEIAFPTQDEMSKIEASPWRTLVTELDRLGKERQSGQELRLLNEKVDGLSGTGSYFSGFALWGLHLERFNTQLRMIERLRPAVAEDEMPIARDASALRSRARSLARLWRSYLLANEPLQAQSRLGEIRSFLEEEKQLTERWHRLRGAEAEEPAKNIVGFARQGTLLLDHIRSEERMTLHWPAFLEMREAVAEDAGDLAAQLQQRAASVRDKTGR